MTAPSKTTFIPGFLIAITLGVLIWWLSSLSSWVDSLVAGILGGMLVRSIIGEREILAQGLRLTPKLLIPPGIILYGANLHFDYDIVSPLIWLQILVGVVIVVWLARTVGRWFKITESTSLLLAVGTAVCGASAIIIASDAVGGRKRDTTTSILVITTWGLVGLGLLPLAARFFNMGIGDQALLYATTLHQTGFVKAAAMNVSDLCLQMAIAIKAARIVMIIPLLLVVGTIYYLPYLLDPTSNNKKYRVRIPWYLWCFIISGLCFTFIPALAGYIPLVGKINSLVWTMAMVSIGLTVDAKSVITSLGKPLLAGLIIWLGLLGVFLYTYFNLRQT